MSVYPTQAERPCPQCGQHSGTKHPDRPLADGSDRRLANGAILTLYAAATAGGRMPAGYIDIDDLARAVIEHSLREDPRDQQDFS